MTENYYMQKVECGGGCSRCLTGLIRSASQKFTPEEENQFFDAVRSEGWSERGGAWYCRNKCPGSPFSPEKLNAQFALSPEQRARLKDVKINPDFFGVVRVQNL